MSETDGEIPDEQLDKVSGGGVVLEDRPVETERDASIPALGGPDTKSSTQLGPVPHLGPQPQLVPDGSNGGT